MEAGHPVQADRLDKRLGIYLCRWNTVAHAQLGQMKWQGRIISCTPGSRSQETLCALWVRVRHCSATLYLLEQIDDRTSWKFQNHH